MMFCVYVFLQYVIFILSIFIFRYIHTWLVGDDNLVGRWLGS